MLTLHIFSDKKNTIYSIPHRPYKEIRSDDDIEISTKNYIFLLKDRENIFAPELKKHLLSQLVAEIKNENHEWFHKNISNIFFGGLFFPANNSFVILKEEIKFIVTENISYDFEEHCVQTGMLSVLPTLKSQNKICVNFNGEFIAKTVFQSKEILAKYFFKNDILPIEIKRREKGFVFFVNFQLKLLHIYLYTKNDSDILISRGKLKRMNRNTIIWEINDLKEKTLSLQIRDASAILCKFESDLMSYSNILIRNIKLERKVESWIGYRIKGQCSYFIE